MTKTSSFKSISFFSGAFGLDLGIEFSGINNALAIDHDQDCVNTLKINGINAIQADVKDLIKKDPSCKSILNLTGLENKDLFLISGGPPCQSYSTAGKRGFDIDLRGSLLYDFVNIIIALKPRFFTIENVRGLLSAKSLNNKGEAESVLSVVKKNLEKSGYRVIGALIDTVNYGVPQHRDRVIILGSRDHENIFIPKPTHFQSHQCKNLQWKTLGSAIKDLENNPGNYLDFSQTRKKIMTLVPPGGNWKNLPKEIQGEAMGGAINAQGGKTSFYRRLDYSIPSPTLTTSPGQRATTLCHPIHDRPLSIKEYARIQQFPDSWKLIGNTASIYRQLGNAVPVNLGKAIGEMFVSVANNSHYILSKKRAYSENIFS